MTPEEAQAELHNATKYLTEEERKHLLRAIITLMLNGFKDAYEAISDAE